MSQSKKNRDWCRKRWFTPDRCDAIPCFDEARERNLTSHGLAIGSRIAEARAEVARALAAGTGRGLASRGGGRAHRIIHPLCGASPDTLARLLLQGGIRPGRAHVAAIAVAASLLRLPFTAGEDLADAMLRPFRRRAEAPPVFIVGHWRSGTTFLTNLLSLFPGFGFLSPVAVGLPLEARSLGRLLRPFIEEYLPPNRLIDDIPLRADLPQEDELALANLSTLSCNHGLYFPDRLLAEFERGIFFTGADAREIGTWKSRALTYIGRMTRANGNRRLLVRNPSNSARIPLLAAMWPDAAFIHIHRDPPEVVQSSSRMFATLIRELSLGGTGDAAELADALVRATYPRLMRALDDGMADLPTSRHVHLRYADFARDPLATLEHVHDRLGIAGFAAGRANVASALAGASPHLPSRVDRGSDRVAWLADHPDIFARWGYEPVTAGAASASA